MGRRQLPGGLRTGTHADNPKGLAVLSAVAAPAVLNVISAVTGKRIHGLPLKDVDLS